MRANKVALYAGLFGGFAFVFFVVGTLVDDVFAAEFYLGRNAFADLYEAIGKMPAFVMLAVAGGIGGQYFLRVYRVKWVAALFYALTYAVCAINFKDATDLLTDSDTLGLVACAAVGAALACVVGFATARIAEERLCAYFKWAVAVAVAVVAVGVIVFAVKEVFSRARYLDVVDGTAAYAPWYDFVRVDGGDSMPSGHTAYTAVLFMLMPLTAIEPRFAGRERAVAALAMIATLVTACARVSDGHHYLSDVSAAAVIAVAVQVAVLFGMYGKGLDKLRFKKFFVPKEAR